VRRIMKFGWNSRFSDEDKFWRFYFMVLKVGYSQDWVIDPIPEGISSRHFTTLYGRFDPESDLPNFEQFCAGLSDLEINFAESL
jgi:hypothetical protein